MSFNLVLRNFMGMILRSRAVILLWRLVQRHYWMTLGKYCCLFDLDHVLTSNRDNTVTVEITVRDELEKDGHCEVV